METLVKEKAPPHEAWSSNRVRKSAPTLKDIAELAGVSYVAASVVINGSRSNSRVSDETRERIVMAAKQLRYSPNAMARGLKNVRLNSLGISFHTLKPDMIIGSLYATPVLMGVMRAASRGGYNVTHFLKPWHDANRSAGGFRGQGIDGFLVAAPAEGSDMVSGLAELGIPLVALSVSSDLHGVPSVDIDNNSGVRQAVEHLINLGHRRIGHLMERMIQYDTVARRDTFLRVMAEHGLSVDPEHICQVVPEHGQNAVPFRYNDTREFLSRPNRPTAVFTTNDEIALCALDAARDLGIRVPEDLSIVGFDNVLESERSNPPLTTIWQPLEQMGEEATEMLIRLIEGHSVPPLTRWYEPELIVRGSTRAPA